MQKEKRHNGAVFLIVVFAIALLTTITVGILVMTTEELQLMQNQLYAANAMCTAEAGLNDAFAQIRTDSSWTTGFTNKAFNGDTYTVTVTGRCRLTRLLLPRLPRKGMWQSWRGCHGGDNSPYVIRIDNLRINE